MSPPLLKAINKRKAIARLQQGGIAAITMSPGQWDTTLQAAYDLGFILLEIGDSEQVQAAYRKPIVDGGQG